MWPLHDPSACRPGTPTTDGKDALVCLTRQETEYLVMYKLAVEEWVRAVRARCE